MTRSQSHRTRIVLFTAAALVVAGSAAFADRILGLKPDWGPLQTAGVVAGAVLFLFGLLPLSEGLSRISIRLCVAFLSVCFFLAVAEPVSRLVGYDFARGEQNHLATPLYFRMPRTPLGEAYFKREGSQRWQGNVLSTRLQQLGVRPDPYADDPPIDARYDADGFRNPAQLTDWEVVVAGDSFTELGYLPDEDMFTTILAADLGLRVKNLGTAGTATLTQLAYIENFGLSESTRHVVIAFFEGNDQQELMREYQALRRFEETGERELREIEKQTSVLRAVYAFASRLDMPAVRDRTEAFFETAEGRLPLSMLHAPPAPEDMPDGFWEVITEALDFATDRYASLASEHGVTPWMVYVPCKLRVYGDLVEYEDHVSDRIRKWQPTALPQVVQEACEARGIRFVDLSPALREAASEQRVMLYNTIYDTHLNAEGSRFVGHELARRMRSQTQQGQ